jgi:dTDP-4-dehydrorhamnose 3,5-epimerase
MSTLVEPVAPWSGPLDPDVAIPALVYTPLPLHTDERGWLVKVFQASQVAGAGGEPEVREVFLTSSSQGTIRGLHFQVPPEDQAKTVACVRGAVLDVVVDLRVGSPTEGRAACFRLDGAAPGRLHVPRGLAHGYQALTDGTVVVYITSSEYAPDEDGGVRWDSVDVHWPLPLGNISPRDRELPRLDEFVSPFSYDGRG